MHVIKAMPLPASAQAVEDALDALAAVMADLSLPLDVRKRAGQAHRLMHPCRDPVTVRRMEREQGLRE